jgi:hypothetical protein
MKGLFKLLGCIKNKKEQENDFKKYKQSFDEE